MSPRPNHLPAWQDFHDTVELADSELVGARFQFTYFCRGALKKHVASFDGIALLTGCQWGNTDHTVILVPIDLKRINMRPGCTDPIHVVREFWIPDSSFPDGYRNRVIEEDLFPEPNTPSTYSTVVINALRGLSAYDLYVQQGGNLTLQQWLQIGGYSQEVMQTINSLVTNLRETLGLDIAQAIQTAHQAMVDAADRAAAQAQASAQSAQQAADSVQQAADLASEQATAQAQAAAQSAQTATAEAESAHAQAEASQQAADAAAADLAEARAKVAQILAAITGLDPSQSPYDAIVAEAVARSAKDAELEGTLAQLDPKIDEFYPEVNASWNQDDCTIVGFVYYNTGAISGVSGYTITDYIEIPYGSRSCSYTTTWVGSSNGLAFYNDRKEYISGIKATNTTTTTEVPTNAKYVRFTNKDDKTVSCTITGGGIDIWKKNFEDNIIDKVGREYSITYDNSDAIYDGYVDYNSGNIGSASTFDYTDYIEVFGKSLLLTTDMSAKSAGLCFYDAEKTFIKGTKLTSFNDYELPIPSNAKYIRFSAKPGTTTRITLSSSDKADGLNKTIDFLLSNVEEKIVPVRHVLMFGNSFTNNACANIGTIASNCGLSMACSLQTCDSAGSALSYWASRTDISAVNKATRFGKGLGFSSDMDTLLSQPWDIVVFQQVSDYSGEYSSYLPYLAILIHKVRTLCTNKNVKIAFHMTWEAKNQTYESIVATMKSLKEDFGQVVDIIIPNGTAIENIRQTSLAEGNNDFSFNSPKWHLSAGVGEYVAGCCLFQSLFGDMIEGSIYDDTTSIAQSSEVGSVAVDDSNRLLCQKAAMYACVSPFNTVNIENI